MPRKRKNPIEKIITKTKKENPEFEEVRNWIDKIKTAQKVRESWKEKFRIELAYEYRDGAQMTPGRNSNEWITINKIYTNLQSELPSLYSADPYYFIKLSKTFKPSPLLIALYEQKGKIRQSMLNYMKKELKLKPKMRLSILDAYFQYGIAKTHYTADSIENPDAGQPLEDNDGSMMISDDGQPLTQPDTLTVNEVYKLTRIHPDDFGWDADAGTLEDTWDFVYEIIRMPLKDAQDYEKYDKSARKKIKATEIDAEQAEKQRERRKKGQGVDDVKPTIAVMLEIYNLKKEEWFVVSEGCPEYLIKPSKVPKGTEKHPYSILRLGLLRDDSPYPIPPVSQWIDPQREYNELRSKILTHRKRFNRKYEMVEDAFNDPDTAASQLEYGDDGTVLRRNASFPGQAVFPISDASLDQNHIQELIMLRNDFEELSTGANQQGSGAGIDSATEAGIVEKRLLMREGDNIGLVMDFATDVGRKLDQLVQAYITKDQAIRVTGPEGEYWEIVRTDAYEEIEGEYEYSINVGSTLPHLPEIERAQFMQFLGLIGQFPQLATVKPMLKKWAEMTRIDDETLIDGIHQMAMKIIGGQMQLPGRGGSPAGQPDMTTMIQSALGGAGAGINNIRGGQQ